MVEKEIQFLFVLINVNTFKIFILENKPTYSENEALQQIDPQLITDKQIWVEVSADYGALGTLGKQAVLKLSLNTFQILLINHQRYIFKGHLLINLFTIKQAHFF